MSLPVEQGPQVFCDLEVIARHIRHHNPAAALRFLHSVYDTFEFLGQFPALGRPRPELEVE